MRGALTTLYSFCAQSGCPDGEYPDALVRAPDGNFYGTTAGGGNNSTNCNIGCGTVFKMTPRGTLTTLYSFCSQSGCPDGSLPMALLGANDGNFYGTTEGGGNQSCTYGCGTVFKITPSGRLTTLYSFCSERGCTDGSRPTAALVQATNGDFYGTTQDGGEVNGNGTVFSL
jgi:uncharacterized repeat protein (TIGR03803 family)